MRWKVTYKGYAHKTWIEMYKIVTANSKEDAIKKIRPLGRNNF